MLKPTHYQDIRIAIKRRDASSIVRIMFDMEKRKPDVGYATENELWDYKSDLPRQGKGNENAWADLAKEILAFYNTHGGVMIFGIDNAYRFIGARNRLDSKQLNDSLRRYIGDRIWIDFNREFIQSDQSFLGVALIPPRGAVIERFRASAPEINGKRSFDALFAAIRVGDSTRVISPAEADDIERGQDTQRANERYYINEHQYRIFKPDYAAFVNRPTLCDLTIDSLGDDRVSVVSLIGIGGTGKTALATWAAINCYKLRKFNYIISVTAKDRQLTRSGIDGLRPDFSSFEEFLKAVLDVMSYTELYTGSIDEIAKNVLTLLAGANALLIVDNLETVDDERIISFLDFLPRGSKALVTSRRTRVRNLSRTIEVKGLEESEIREFVRVLSQSSQCSYLAQLKNTEIIRLGDDCEHLPLAIKWLVQRSKSAVELLNASGTLKTGSKRGEELLEFAFRRIFESMAANEVHVIRALSAVNKPMQIEAICIGTEINFNRVEDALGSLSEDSLVAKHFDSNLNDVVYSLPPVVRLFMDSSHTEHQVTVGAIRQKLVDWYDARDVTDPNRKSLMRNLRSGNVSPESGLLELAWAAEKKRDFDGAEGYYQNAIDRCPNSWKAASQFAEFQRHKRNNCVLAIKYYNQALQNAPRQGQERAILYREFGFLIRDSGESNAIDQAVGAFSEAYKETPNDPMVIYGLGSQLAKKGSHTDAIRILSPIIESGDPTSLRKCLPILEKCLRDVGDLLEAARVRVRITEIMT